LINNKIIDDIKLKINKNPKDAKIRIFTDGACQNKNRSVNIYY